MNKSFTLIFLFTAFILAPLISSIGQTKPTATIISPVNGSTYIAGQTIELSGTGTDAKDGNLPDAAFKWVISLVHGKESAQHVHYALSILEGKKTGQYSIEKVNDHNLLGDVYIRIDLIVKNSQGQYDTTESNIYPLLSNVRVETIPSGLEVGIFGTTPLHSPISAISIVNSTFISTVDTIQTINGKTYKFKSWNNVNKNILNAFDVPNSDTVITAYFDQITNVNNSIEESIISIFPNPGSETLIVNIPQKDLESISITNNLGKEYILNHIPFGSGIKVYISSYPSGIYYLNIKTDKKYFSQKIVINHPN